MLNLFWFRRWWKCMLIHWNASHCTPSHHLRMVCTAMVGNKNGLENGSEKRIIEEKAERNQQKTTKPTKQRNFGDAKYRAHRGRVSREKEAFLMGFKWIFSFAECVQFALLVLVLVLSLALALLLLRFGFHSCCHRFGVFLFFWIFFV